MKNIKIFLLIALFAIANTVSAQYPDNLFMIGSATPNGWDYTKGICLEQSAVMPGVYTWTGALKTGDFKIVERSETWMPAYCAPTENEPVIVGVSHTLLRNLSYEYGDYKFIIVNPGTYNVRVDISGATPTMKIYQDVPTFTFDGITAFGAAVGNDSKPLIKIDDLTYLYRGKLENGELKFKLSDGTVIVPVEEDIDILAHGSLTAQTAETAGFNVVVPSAYYEVLLDFRSMTVSARIVKPRSALYLVGGATKPGWCAELALPFEQDSVDPYLFTFHGILSHHDQYVEPLSFKILGQLGWGPYQLHPTTDLLDILDETAFVENGVDTKWTISPDRQGMYTIKVHTFNHTVTATYEGPASDSPYPDNLYMIGGACESGWILENAVPFVKDPRNPAIFTFKGILKYRAENVEPTRFKILGQYDWAPLQLHPEYMDADITETSALVVNGDDNKWSLGEGKEGLYTITVNLETMTVTTNFARQTHFADIEDIASNDSIRVWAENGTVVINHPDSEASAAIYNINGTLVASATGRDRISLGNNLRRGIYLVVINTPHTRKTIKLALN